MKPFAQTENFDRRHVRGFVHRTNPSLFRMLAAVRQRQAGEADFRIGEVA